MLPSFQTFFDAFSMINNVQLPTGNLGIMRSQMPQIDGPHQAEFVNWLATKGIESKHTQTQVDRLMLTQNEINKAKVFKLMTMYRAGQVAKWAPVIVSKDGFVIDGSHRFVAIYNIDRYSKIKIIKVDAFAKDLVLLAQTFPRVKYRNHSDASVKP